MSAAISKAGPPGPAPVRFRAPDAITIVAAAIVLGWVAVAVAGSYLLAHDPADFVSDDGFAPAGPGHWLGTDYLGRDMLARLVSSARATLLISVLATLIAHVIGDTLALLAALRGGFVDNLLGRVAEVMLSVPKLIVGLVVIAVVGPSWTVLVLLTGTVYAATVFRISRAAALDIVTLDYVRAARVRGERLPWLMFGEVLPNMLGLLAADFALRISFSILFVSNLSFLGLGLQPPEADWGGLVRENLGGLAVGSPVALYPTLAIASVAVALNVLVDRSGAGDPARRDRT